MDPNAWLQFVQRAMHSPETLSFLIVGIGIGGILGFLFGRWFSSHAALMKHLEAQRAHSEILKPDPRHAKLAVTPPRAEKSPIGDPPRDPASDALWGKVEHYLVGRGIDRSSLMRLKDAMSTSGKTIMNSDNRQRIMLWSDGPGCLPVAMIWRAEKNPRVLFPDGTESNVSNGHLEEISGKI